MKKLSYIALTICLALSTLAANAQFNKPLQSASQRKTSNVAKYNVGITGGLSLTHWIHTGGLKNDFEQPVTDGLGPVFGVSVERLLNNRMSISLEGFYAMRKTKLTYNSIKQLAIAYGYSSDYQKNFSIEYNQIEIQVPVTYYLSSTQNARIKPYVFVAPRISIPLSGTEKMESQLLDSLGNFQLDADGNPSSILVQTDLNKSNFRQFNVGLVGGVGVLFTINTNNYYFLIKVDASYNYNLINSYTKDEKDANVPNVLGVGYIEPSLLGKRFITDATLKATILFPLKKQLKGACMRWGEYD